MDDMDEIRQVFFTECAELLVDMEDRLMKLEVGSTDMDQINAIFRCAHSIKGGSGAFGFNEVMQFTHVLEALLDNMREGKMVPTKEAIDLLLKSADIVTQMLDLAKNGQPVPAGMGADVQAELVRLTQGAGSAAPAPVAAVSATVVATPPKDITYDIAFGPFPELFATGNEPLNIFRELKRLGDLNVSVNTSKIPDLAQLDPTLCYLAWKLKLKTKSSEEEIREAFEFVMHVSDLKIDIMSNAAQAASPAPDVAPVAAAPVMEAAPASVAEKKPAAEAAKPAAAAASSSATTSIRVDLEKVDRLVNMVGELVITEAMLRSQSRHMDTDQLATFMRGLDELSHHTRELQEAVMAVRMQPVKSIFSRMPRIVRDTSAQLGKDIQLILSGENTEVDKTVIEQLSDPLTHMIRNSIDHGIETPDQRVWNDKPQQGTIHLSAYHRGGRIIIEIQDDGAGINRQRVLGKAIEKGLIPADAKLSDEEIDHLIFLPGFSTAEKVTSVSGRGVGMDVVRRNIEGIGGSVHITNMPGKGSIFTVSLPLTLAILDGMIVRVGSEEYIVPIGSIIETLRPKQDEIKHVEGRSDVINVRGEFVPVVHLNHIFKIENAIEQASEGLIVLVESGKEKLGIVVDELIGQQQVVIKSLEANADPVDGISGATILGDGKVSLILDIDELKTLCRAHTPVSGKAA